MPVLVTPPVSPGAVHVEDAKRLIGRIVVPVDLSPASIRQTQLTGRLAKALGLPVVLVHVIEPVRSALLSRLRRTGLDSSRRAVAEESLERLVALIPASVRSEDRTESRLS